MASTQSTPTPTLSHEQHDYLVNDDASNARRKQHGIKRSTTAERRATHNAVERARRETLNGRFVHLANILPNLHQIRRPSKSAIVNSSIAHINASRRHRQLASRVSQDLLREADELRRELNEWRERAGIRKVEPRVRTEGFSMVVRGELEPISISPDEEDDEDYHFQEQINMVPGRGQSHISGPYPQTMPRPLMQRHASYGPTLQAPMLVSPTAPAHFDQTHYAPSHQQVVSAPHTALPSPSSAPPVQTSPIASHHISSNTFAHSVEPQFIPQDHEKPYHASYATSLVPQLVGQWSDDSSSSSSTSMEQCRSAHGSGCSSSPHSPLSYDVSSATQTSFEFNTYEYDYDLVPPSSSSGSSDGFMSNVPRGLSAQTMVQSPVRQLDFGMLGVV